MDVEVTKSFRAVRPGEVYPVEIPAGETVSGRLAEIALALKSGTQVPDKAAKARPKAPAATAAKPGPSKTAATAGATQTR